MGSWELQQQTSVLVAILHVDVTTIAWAFGLRNLIVPGQVIGLAGMPFDQARNVAAQQVLQNSFQWLFFLDSDVIPPRDAILRLLAHRVPLISGLYCRRSPPHGVPVMIKDKQWVTQYQRGAVIDVDLVGAGCLLIHRSVIENFFANPQRPGKPVFDWRVDMQGIMPAEQCLSEDFTMCSAWRSRGGRVLVDTGIECRHVGLAQAGYGSFVPCEANPIT